MVRALLALAVLLLPVTATAQHIESVTPRVAAPGAHISVRGTGLDGVEVVLIDGQRIAFQRRDSHTLSFRMPELGGTLVLVSAVGLVRGPTLRLRREPVVESFEPARADPGDLLTIRGQNLATGFVEVRLGELPLETPHVADDHLTVRVPRDAVSGTITVRTDDGEVGRALEVLPPFFPRAARAGSFYPGDRIEVTGDGLDEGVVARLEEQPDTPTAPLERRGRGWSFVMPGPVDEYEVRRVNLEDTYGRVRALDVSAVAPEPFEVGSPQLDCRPIARDEAGRCRVEVSGRGLSLGRTTLQWGRRRLPVERSDRTRIVARIDPTWVGMHRLVVRNGPRRFVTESLQGPGSPRTEGGLIGICCPDDGPPP